MATEPTKILSLRVPITLDRQLQAMARREFNGVAATVRRLLADAVNRESRAA